MVYFIQIYTILLLIMKSKSDKNKIIHLKDIKRSLANPFIVELKGKMYLQPKANVVLAQGEAIIDKVTGEIKDDSVLMGKRRVVDKSHFAKLYASEIGLLYELSKPAINVFLYVSKIMDYENKALFNYASEYKRLGYKSHNPALKGIKELIVNGILYPHEINMVWWVNPVVICKGERFAKYIEYVTKEYAEKEAQQRAINEIKNKKIETDQDYKISLANKKMDDQYNKTGEFKTNTEDDYK